jgi:ornithine decarboxylase
MKCNPDQAMVNTLVACGAGLDCASMAEMQQGLASGVSPDKMIFANPCKMIGKRK